MTYLAIDQGGHSSRALLFDRQGMLVATGAAPVRTLHPAPGHVEHDPEELLASLRRAIDEACACLPGGTRIAAAGLATQRSSMVCWDRRTGAALSPVISWQDRRNAEFLRTLATSAAEVRAHTGLVLNAHYGASKMRWCLKHLPAVQAAARAGTLVMGPLASFILHRLLDERPLVVDPANASRTQLWDPDSRDWSPELLALFGIDRQFLPAGVTSRHAYGSLSTPAGPVPLIVTTGDQSAVPFAFGPLDAATAYVNAGTGAFVQRGIRDRMPTAPRLLASVVWSDAAGVDYMLEGTVNGAGSALDWFATAENADLPPLLAKLAANPSIEPAPPLFLNGVGGLGSPYWRSDFTPRFFGAGTALARLAAVLESVAFLLAVNLEELAPHGPAFRQILLTGGLAANDYFVGALAGISGLPVLRSLEPEATARGLARLVANDAAAAWETPATERWPAGESSALVTRYRRWRAELAGAL